MARDEQLFANDFVFAEGSSGWVIARDDEVLKNFFYQSPVAPNKQDREYKGGLRKKMFAAIGVAALIIVSWIAWPYYVVYDLISGIKSGNEITLENRIDWDSVRQGVKADINADWLASVYKNNDSSAGAALGTGLAMVMAPSIVNQSVDSLLTPASIAAAVKSKNTDGKNSTDKPNVPREILSLDFDKIKYAFFAGDPFTFLIQVNPAESDNDSLVKAVMRWSGTWRLTRVYLPKQLKSTSTPKQKEEDAKKAAESPLAVSLVYKGFKDRNIRNNDFEDDITFVLEIKNKSERDIRAFDGVITFTDLLDNKLLASHLAINDTIPKGKIITWNGQIEYNQFKEDHKRLRYADQNAVKLKFIPHKILYGDGTMADLSK